MDRITKAGARTLSEDTEVALRKVAEKHGLAVEVRGGRFDPHVGTYRPRVEFSLPDSEAKEFALNASMFGLKPEHYGAEVKSGGRTFRLVMIRPRASRYPLIGEDLADGKRYKLPESAARLLAEEWGR